MALQDHKKDPWRHAARIWAVALLALLAGCSSAHEQGVHGERMRLYRKYYHDLTPAQRREYLSGRFESPESAERSLKAYAEDNRSRSETFSRLDRKTADVENVWSRAEAFLARAESSAATAEAHEKAQLQADCRELLEALKSNEARITRTPYEPGERVRLLQRNSYYVSRLQAMQKVISKND